MTVSLLCRDESLIKFWLFKNVNFIRFQSFQEFEYSKLMMIIAILATVVCKNKQRKVKWLTYNVYFTKQWTLKYFVITSIPGAWGQCLFSNYRSPLTNVNLYTPG